MVYAGNVVKKMKKIYKTFILILLISVSNLLVGCVKITEDNYNVSIISTSFPGYDFARAIVKDVDGAYVKMLLKPGSETHDYEPTPKDIIDIMNSDIFIYVGGDSDEWIDSVLDNIDTSKTKVIKLMDLVDTVYEEAREGMENTSDEHEYDEHVWTNPKNAITITNSLKDEIVDIDIKNKEKYENNTNNYIDKINDIDTEIRSIVKSAKRKELIFGDRFPLRYFVDEYDLSYYAAFPGCSEQTEASAKTIGFLVDKVKSDNIPVVLKIELSSGKIAESIAKETNTKVLEFHSAHNISQSDFDSGVTYVDLMKRNIEVLKEALL